MGTSKSKEGNDVEVTGSGSDALPVLPAIKLGKVDAVLTLLSTFIGEAQQQLQKQAETLRGQMRATSRRPIDVKEGGELVGGLTYDNDVTPEQKNELLKTVMDSGYEVETDPDSLGLWVLTAVQSSQILMDKAKQFVLLIEMEDEEFLNHKERSGWFSDEGLFKILERQANDLFDLDAPVFRARFVHCLEHASEAVIGRADPKALIGTLLANFAEVAAQVAIFKQTKPAGSYLTGSPPNTGGPRG